MSIHIEASTLVIRKDRLEVTYPGGYAGFLNDALNQTVRADEHLCAQSFMLPTDLHLVVGLLSKTGLVGKQGEDWVDMVPVMQDFGVLGNCDWLEFDRLPDGRSIAWLKGTQPGESVSFGKGKQTSTMEYFSPEDIAKYLRYVGIDGNNTVWIDTRTGEKRYMGHISGEIAGGQLPNRLSWLEHLTRKLGNGGLVDPADAASSQLGDIAEEAAYYSALPGRHQYYAAFVQGLALRTVSNWGEAECAFLNSVELGYPKPDIWLEINWCLGEQGKLAEALEAADKAVSGMPDSAAAWGNKAATLMNMWKLAEARKTIAHALKLDPDDEINLSIDAMLAAREGLSI